jgi:hypothetical protein
MSWRITHLWYLSLDKSPPAGGGGGELALPGESACHKPWLTTPLSMGIPRPSGIVSCMGNLCAGNYSLFLKTSLDRFNLAIGDHEDNIDPFLSLCRALYTPWFSHAVGKPAQASQRRVFYLRVSTRRVSTHRSSLRRGFSTPIFS